MKNNTFFLLFSIFVLASFFSCRGTCDKPGENRKTIAIPVRLANNSSPTFCERFASTLVGDFKANNAKMGIFGTSLTENSKWVAEFLVVGDCGNNGAWKELIKKGTWTAEVKSINGEELLVFKLPEIPITNKFTVTANIYSPQTLCPDQTKFRSHFPKAIDFTINGSTQPEVEVPIEEIMFSGLVK